MLTGLRWALILPAAWAGWSLALILGIGAHSLLEKLCPKDQVVSGMCVAPWFSYAEKAVFCGGAAVAAALIVLFTTLVAPGHRPTVALLAFTLGCVGASYMAVAADAYAELATAVVVGLLVTWWLRTRPWRHESRNIGSERGWRRRTRP